MLGTYLNMHKKWMCLFFLITTALVAVVTRADPVRTTSSRGFPPLSYADDQSIDDLQLSPLDGLDENASPPPPSYLFVRLYRDLVSAAMEKGSRRLAEQALPHQQTWINASLVGLPLGDGGFRWYSDAGFLFRPESDEAGDCPWDLHHCVSDELSLKFGFLYVEDVDGSAPSPNLPIHLLTLASKRTKSSTKQGPSFSIFYEPRRRSIVALGTFFAPLEAILSTETTLDWISVSLSVKPFTGEVQLIVKSADASISAVPIEDLEVVKSLVGGNPGEVGLHVGPVGSPFSATTFLQILDQDSIQEKNEEEYADDVLMGAALSRPIRQIQRTPVSNISFEDRSSYVRYNFHNWIREPTTAEKVVLEFIIPDDVTSGLLWFVEDKNYKRYIILKDRKLYYKYIKLDQTSAAKWTLTEEIAINEHLLPRTRHTLTIQRAGDVLRLTINKRPAVEKATSERVPLIPVGGQVYLGGTEDAAQSTLGEVDRNFRGKVSSAEVSLSGPEGVRKVDMLDALHDPKWTGRVYRGRGVQYEYHVSKRPSPVLRPTASSRGYAGITLSRTPIPVTYMGTQNSVVRFDTWDFSVYRSFELEFRTFEPHGVLFFVGPDREHTDFVCVELFDGNVYFVYGIGDHYRHIQLNPETIKVNTGTAHRVYVERTPEHRFIVKYNGMEVDVDQGTSAHQAEFSSYTYIGSIDQPSRLPWVVWSRENFAGCINSIRINDDKFLDPASRMNQHTDLSRGIQFGVCKAPDPRCTRQLCGGGQCHERSHPFFEPVNFACDCSASDKTFREGVEDIRRSEVCNRDSPIVNFDGETVVMLDFERQMNTLTTHTDDIDIQFRTKNPDGPIFNAVSSVERQFLRVDLQGGQIKVTTNINRASNPGREQSFLLAGPRLDDDQWHTLRLRRRAQHLYISVDNRNEQRDMLIVNIPKGVFNQIAQQIYVGGQAPADYATPPFQNMAGFLPPGPKFTGDMRNFYWNQYDFFGTPRLATKYTTEILTPRLELPEFPSWPREPTYSITCNPGLQWATLDKPMVAKDAGDMWIVEFKTQYDGVLLHARDVKSSAHFTLIILKGRLHFVYNVGGVTGVHEFVNGPSAAKVTDLNWHRVTFGIDRIKGRFILMLDGAAPELVGYRLRHEDIDTLIFHFGGVVNKWREVYNIIRTYAPTALPIGSEEAPPAITGCIGGFSSRADRFNVDLLKKYDPQLRSYPDNQIVRGYCRDVVRCTPDICSNGGTCYIYGGKELRCNCSGTGCTGSRCEIRITTCPPNYCLNGGTCAMIGSRPVCTCASPIYQGERCERTPCDDPNYCQNGGRCSIVNNVAVCDCRRTGYTGARCTEPACPPNYCRNGGVCRINEYTNEPYCECAGTGYGGRHCDQRVCEAGFCRNGGVCRIENNRPVCDCAGTGYGGPLCDQPICSPGYCLNGGRCVVRGGAPYCDCTYTGYGGPRCEQTLCQPGYCANNGVCRIEGGQPVCDCRNTGYGGSRCEQPVCQPGYCLNNGICRIENGQPVCDCGSSGYEGPRCEQTLCQPGYCLNNGVCRIEGGRPVCDCRNSGYGGSRCEQPVCQPGYCLNNGICRIENGRPVCDCHNTGYEGPRCGQTLCQSGYCLNNGVCRIEGGRPVCDCRNSGYGGPRCEQPVCQPGYCLNNGICRIEHGRPVCDCRNTGYEGPRCGQTLCQPGYCLNNGVCRIEGGRPVCDCRNSGYGGPRCEQPVCQPGYCLNNGICRIENGRPVCDCRNTGYEGPRCEQTLCQPGYCLNNGVCRIEGGRPVCDCHNTGYEGPRCEQTLCQPGYCLNNGICRIEGGRPICDCRNSGYEGSRCEQPICRPGYCLNNGICTIENGRPVCDCRSTGHTGERCEQPVCRPGFCQNNGRCIISANGPACDCSGTGYDGPHCERPLCPPDFCLNGGRCVVQNGRPVCECQHTLFIGQRCEQPICTTGYCANGGRCTVSPTRQPVCDCSGTTYSGDRCTYPLCPPNYCANGGRCFVRPGSTRPECDCTGTGYEGGRCEAEVCPADYCQNGGQCRLLPGGQKFCECSGTGYTGSRCQEPICVPGYCQNGGSCRVQNGRPYCDCQPGYWGPQCNMQVCTPGYCHHGGTCVPGEDRRPHCRCPEGYEGERCERPKQCPPGYCYYGGICTMQGGVPHCDCRQTDYEGPRCESPKTCPSAYCQNGGRCSVVAGAYVCDCTGTGFRGPLCTESIACPSDFCLYGGICTVLPNGEFSCDCSRTGRSGRKCEGDTNGVYIDYDKVGYLVYDLAPPVQTTEDNVTVGFKTYVQTGTILDFVTTEGKYWRVKVRDGRLVMDVNGAEYSYRPLVNDGAYHLVNIERRGDSMVVSLDNSEMVSLPMSSIIHPRDGSITYSTLYVGANNRKLDIFRGAIGGLYWNGRYPIDEAKGGLQVVTGEVVYVFLPFFTLPDKKLVVECPPDFCFNGGVCYVDKFELKCDCRGSGWHGPRCERQSRGFIKSVDNNGAYIIIPIVPPETSNLDKMRVAFQTYLPDGPIARFMSPDGNYYEIYMKGQQVFVSMNGENIRLISAPYQQCDDGQMHVIIMERKGNTYTWHVDGHPTIFEDRSVTNQEGVLTTNEIILGADRSFEDTFTGVIGAFDWNGRLLINGQGRLSTDARIMTVPGRGVGSKDDVVIVLMPHILVPPKPVVPEPPIPFPTAVPPHVYGGGIVMPPGGGGGLIVPPVGYGGGASGIFAGAGPLLVQAGGLGFLGAVNPLLAGLLLFLLPLLSALIWACWRCKPGCCPCCMGAGAGGGLGAGKMSSTLSRIKSAVTAAPPEKEPMLSSKGAYAVGGSQFINGGARGAGAPTADLDLTDRYPMIGRPDGANLLTGPNVYAADDMKVDCCVLSFNSKYVVTGSASGPPQVWDMETGEPCKIMDGEELGCNDLHLACNDELLVGQVVDDITAAGSTKMHRLQLWNFATGARLEMPSEIVCSASCVSNEGVHIIAARHTPSGPSILVWDLSGNQLAREVLYAPLNPRAVVSYINITPEDRLVVAGFTNPDDDQAYFMVFDLAAHTTGILQPNFVVFDAKPEATEILNNEEAVTGTRKGELVVWNLLTGQPVRQIEILATLEGGNRANLPPHTGIIHAVTLSADKRYLVTGAQDRLVRVWSMPEERLLHTLEGHADDVLSVTISVDSEMIVSGSWDGSIRVWRTRDGSQMCWFTSNIEVLQVKLSRDKRAIVGLGERNGHRKLIMMQIIRNRTCTSAVYPPGSAGGFSPSSPHLLPETEMV